MSQNRRKRAVIDTEISLGPDAARRAAMEADASADVDRLFDYFDSLPICGECGGHVVGGDCMKCGTEQPDAIPPASLRT